MSGTTHDTTLALYDGDKEALPGPEDCDAWSSSFLLSAVPGTGWTVLGLSPSTADDVGAPSSALLEAWSSARTCTPAPSAYLKVNGQKS